MKSILRAIALLSGGSAVSLVLGLMSAKLSALLLGPEGVGYMGLLQSTLGLAVLVATVGGVSAGMVRAVARAQARDDFREAAASRSAAWLLWGVLSACAAAVMLTLRAPFARVLLGTAERADAMLPLALALILTMATSVYVSLLAAHRRISELARLNVSNSVVGPALLLPLIWMWREAALPWAICAGSAATAVVSRYYVRRSTPSPAIHVSRREIAAAARGLLRFGVSLNASALVGQGVFLAIPIIVLHTLGGTDVGFYRAAAGVSLTYLGFLASAMGQDYYPRLSACRDDAATVGGLVNDQARVVLLIAGPVILALLALVPHLVPLIYTPQFAPTVALLEWQLVGDVLKVSGWTMAYAVLARSGGMTYFGAELVSGASLLLCCWIGVRAHHLEGLGMAFLVRSGIGWLVYRTILRRTIGLRFTRENIGLLTAFFVAALVIRALSYAGLGHLRTPVGLVLAAAGAFASIRIISGELGGLRGVIAWRGLG